MVLIVLKKNWDLGFRTKEEKRRRSTGRTKQKEE